MKVKLSKAGTGTRWEASFSREETGGTNVQATPQDFFDKLNKEFSFNLDPCALPENAKCSKYFTPEINGLRRNWKVSGKPATVFCNPPYGKDLGLWVEKCALESKKGCTVVLLVFARTDTKWFHDWVLPYTKEIRFVKGRLKFGEAKNSAPAPSLVVVFRPTFEENKCS